MRSVIPVLLLLLVICGLIGAYAMVQTAWQQGLLVQQQESIQTQAEAINTQAEAIKVQAAGLVETSRAAADGYKSAWVSTTCYSTGVIGTLVAIIWLLLRPAPAKPGDYRRQHRGE